MIFRQLFDSVSGTYTYLIASRYGGEALIIDPVLEKVDRYLQLVRELDLKLVKAADTHLHADHVTGLGALRDRGFWSEVQRVYENRIWTSLPSSLRIPWNAVLKSPSIFSA
jgi:glyoxylase-like metal-dependent hydrolase (beta-lactamase superfamily II)